MPWHWFVGEIRCFCNQPACVSTSYMCKSHIGMCFLQTTQDGDTTRTVHACAETLSENQRYACAQIEDDVTSTQKIPDENTRLDLICCRTDMCNYKPRLFINIYISRMNGTSATGQQRKHGYSFYQCILFVRYKSFPRSDRRICL